MPPRASQAPQPKPLPLPLPCERCQNPSYEPYRPDSKLEVYRPGDILAIHERTSVPVYHFLTGRSPSSRMLATKSWGSMGYVAWSRLKATLGNSPDATTSVGQPREPRPCVILHETPISPSAAEVRVYLFATFGGSGALPRILKHFRIPIYPHQDALPGVTHAHTTPEWPTGGTWILGLVCTSNARVRGRWDDRRHESHLKASFKLSDEQLARIITRSDARQANWQILSLKDRRMADRALQEYRVSTSCLNSVVRLYLGCHTGILHSHLRETEPPS
ncbi:hypothetical protein C8Q79DRAFT_969675 [Trametes meyenii]|nr:hypothetical protein C8Q79DRAFT_969675 [Trametes meyenii]